MKTRFLTGILISAVFVGVILLSLSVTKIVYDIFVLILMVLAALEMCRALRQKFARPMEVLAVIAAICGYAAYFLLQYFGYARFALLGYVAVMLLVFLAAVIWASISKYKNNQNIITTAFALVYPLMVLVFMLSLNYLSSEPGRAAAIVLLFLVAPFTDVFAYLVGSTLKGPKLCPRISPKKTISGAIGGLLGGILGGLAVFGMIASGWFTWMGLVSFSRVDAVHLTFLGLLGSVFTQAGDLLASTVKRKCGIKDYGRLLPGHGGIMDRIDGMMLAAFIISVYMEFLGVL